KFLLPAFDFALRCARMLLTLSGELSIVSPAPAMKVLRETQFAGLTPAVRGKVRDVYDLGEKLLIVATDRLSAFDVILPTPIPDKGRVLTQLSLYRSEEHTSELQSPYDLV